MVDQHKRRTVHLKATKEKLDWSLIPLLNAKSIRLMLNHITIKKKKGGKGKNEKGKLEANSR